MSYRPSTSCSATFLQSAAASLKYFAVSAQELNAIERMGNKKIATALGLPQSTMKRWFRRLRSEGETVSHSVGRGGWFVSCVLLFSAHISRIVRDLCVFSVGPMILSGACSCQDACCWHHCRHTMLHSRPCSQISAGIWHRARPQQRPEAHEGEALARSVGELWLFFLHSYFVALPLVKHQHLTALDKPRRLEWRTTSFMFHSLSFIVLTMIVRSFFSRHFW